MAIMAFLSIVASYHQKSSLIIKNITYGQSWSKITSSHKLYYSMSGLVMCDTRYPE
jgi:hypothetical protein